MIGNESSDFRWLLAHAVKLSHSRKEKPKSLIWCALMMIASPVCDLFKRDKYQLFSWCVSCHRSIHLIFFFVFCFFSCFGARSGHFVSYRSKSLHHISKSIFLIVTHSLVQCRFRSHSLVFIKEKKNKISLFMA